MAAMYLPDMATARKGCRVREVEVLAMTSSMQVVRTSRARRAAMRAQSTLEWVIGAAIILGTLATAILAWNQGLASKIGSLVSQLTK
jgi:hypothetical protein